MCSTSETRSSIHYGEVAKTTYGGWRTNGREGGKNLPSFFFGDSMETRALLAVRDGKHQVRTRLPGVAEWALIPSCPLQRSSMPETHVEIAAFA